MEWIKTESGLQKKLIGGSVYEYKGRLNDPVDAINIAFLVHPLSKKEDYRFIATDEKTIQTMEKFIYREELAIAKGKSPKLVESLYNGMGNKIVGDLIVKTANKKLYGILILVPFLPEQYISALELAKNNDDELFKKIINSQINAVNIARETNCRYIGLGAMNSIIAQNATYKNNQIKYLPRRKETIFDDLNILPTTSGNDLTAAGIFEGLNIAIKNKNIDPIKQSLLIIGGTGSVGGAATKIITENYSFKRIILCARNIKKLEIIRKELEKNNKSSIEISTDLKNSIKSADIIISAVSTPLQIKSDCFKENVIICDASQPRSITDEIIANIKNVHFFTGAIFQIPGIINGYEFLRMGEANQAYGCLAATITRGLLKENKCKGNGIQINSEESMELLTIAKNYKIIPTKLKKDNKINLTKT